MLYNYRNYTGFISGLVRGSDPSTMSKNWQGEWIMDASGSSSEKNFFCKTGAKENTESFRNKNHLICVIRDYW